MQEPGTQLREGLLTGTLTGQKVNYLDSGYSEEDPTGMPNLKFVLGGQGCPAFTGVDEFPIR